MADQFGYSQQFTDKPGVWTTDGYVVVGATGAPSFAFYKPNNVGTNVLTLTNSPSSIVKAVVRTGVGAYRLDLVSSWVQLIYWDVKSQIPPALTPAYVGVQLQTVTVGNNAFGPGKSALQSVSFTFNVAGTPTELPQGSGFLFELNLKQSSA